MLDFKYYISYLVAGQKHELRFKSGHNTVKDSHVQIEVKIIKQQEGSTILSIHCNSLIPVVLDEVYLELPFELIPCDRLMLNGYQSKTDTKEFSIAEKMIKPCELLKPFLGKSNSCRSGDYHFTNYAQKKGELHGYSYAYLRKKHEQNVLFIGSLDEDKGFTRFSYSHKNLLFSCSF